MYLISLLFGGIISILVLIFIITTMIGVYSQLNNSAKPTGDSSKFKEKAEEKTSEDKQVSKDTISEDRQNNEEMINDKEVESEEMLVVIEPDLLDTNFSETSIEIDETSQNDNENIEEIVEEQVERTSEIQSNSVNKGKIYVSKSSKRRSKKKNYNI